MLRGRFLQKPGYSCFGRRLKCVTKKEASGNDVDTNSSDCEFEVRFTVVGPLDKDPDDMPDGFKKTALYLVVMETTDHHDWSGPKSTNDASDNDLDFGAHGSMDLSQFGIRPAADLKANKGINKNDLLSLTTKDGIKMVIDKNIVCPEILRMA